MVEKETITLSLGGSLVAPGEIDLGFLKKFRSLVLKRLSKKRFIIYVGGGKICRIYQKALLEFGANNKDRDWIGINVSRLNAEVIRNLFKDISYSKIIIDPTKKLNAKNSVVVGAGWKPGRSTDYVAVLAAKNYNEKIPTTKSSRIHDKIRTIVNLTNINYVYTKDPNKFSDAKPLKEISWKNFRKIVGSKWIPGLSSPFDPEASKLAEKLKLKVAIINGKNLERLENFLDNKPFIGTTIQ